MRVEFALMDQKETSMTWQRSRLTISLIASAVHLTACAGAEVRPIVDMNGVNEARYEKDLAECQDYAKQATGMGGTAAKGAGAGAVVGGLLGLVTGSNTTGIVQAAGAGAVICCAGGAYKGNGSQEAVVKKCLVGRGYKVLN